MSAGAPQLQVPRWIQLVLLPLTLIAAWILGSAVRHALFVFLVSTLIAILLNPLVHAFTRVHLPRALAVLLVYLSFATIVVSLAVIIGSQVVSQVQSVGQTVENEFTAKPGAESPAEKRVDALQVWLNDHNLSRIHVRQIGRDAVSNLQSGGVSKYSKRALDIGQSIATQVVEGIVNLVLIVVVSIYMLLEAPRISRYANRRFPPGPDGRELGRQVQIGLLRYVRGQLLVSVIIGLSAGVAMWIVGALGIWPEASQYALALGVFAMFTEVIPYVGPILGALPAIGLALLHSPLTALWVALVYLGIHQLEGHVVVPRVMGSALRAHPLVVIFTLLAAAELYGIIGALLALPLLAIGREVMSFFHGRITFEPWPRSGMASAGLDVAVPVVVENPEALAAAIAREHGDGDPDGDETD